MHRVLSMRSDRSIATHEGIQAPRDTANLSRFVARVSPSWFAEETYSRLMFLGLG